MEGIIMPILAVVIFTLLASILYKENKEKKQKVEEKSEYFDKLLELQKLKEKNILTEAEFEREKAKIKPTE